MRTLALVLLLGACGKPVAGPYRWPFTFTMPDDQPDYTAVFDMLAAQLNERAGCTVATNTHDPSDLDIKLVPLGYSDDPCATFYNNNGVSHQCITEYGPGGYEWGAPKHVTVFMFTSNLPPEESTSGTLSPCEAGYLYLWWIGQFMGVVPTYDYESRFHMSYAHPNCPGYITDTVGQLLADIKAAGADPCYKGP